MTVTRLYGYAVPGCVDPFVAACTVDGGKSFTLLETEDVDHVVKLLTTLGKILEMEPNFLPSLQLTRRRGRRD
jgi:hypothetical protein